MSTRPRKAASLRQAASGALALTVGLVLCGLGPAQAAQGPATGRQLSQTRVARPMSNQACVVPVAADDAVLAVLKSASDARSVSDTVRLAVFEAAWVESHATSLPCGDADSLGVFQQRPSMGWGSTAQVQDPKYAVTKFLDKAIPIAAKNPTWTAGRVAQSVQRSAYPSRYDEVKAKAEELIKRSNALSWSALVAGQFTWPLVQYGEANNRVIAVQHLLRQAGTSTPVDGKYGLVTTKAAVSSFQTSRGLTVDGRIGAATWKKLVVTLTPGSKGQAVTALQKLLRVHGFSAVAVTGTLDAATAKAVSTFRTNHRLSAGTTVDVAVWNALVSTVR